MNHIDKYDGVKFDMEDIKSKAFKMAKGSPVFMTLLQNAMHRIMNDEYCLALEIGKRDIFETYPGPQDGWRPCSIDKCRIVCPGPSMNQVKIQREDPTLTIVCNKAIEYSAINWLWLVTDGNAQKCNWFEAGNAVRKGRDCCFPSDSLGAYNPEYTMHIAPCFPPQHDQRLMPGVILNGATIAGMALQVAFYLEAKTIELYGCDFDGDEYFDGTKTGGNHSWDEFRTRMNSFIKVVQHQGVEVYSRTETTLDVEVRD